MVQPITFVWRRASRDDAMPPALGTLDALKGEASREAGVPRLPYLRVRSDGAIPSLCRECPVTGDQDRLLSVLHIAAPAPVGGLEAVVQTLAMGHSRRGHRVGVVAVVDMGQRHHPFLEPLLEAGVEVFPVELPPRAYLRERRRVSALIRRFRPEIVHTHGERPDVVDGSVARRMGVPTVTTLHGSSKLGGLGHVYEWMQYRLLRRFAAVVVVSRPLAESVRRYRVRAERIHVVPNCWNGHITAVSRREARRILGIPPERFVVGWVGRLIPVKGADVFLKAITKLGDLPLAVSIVGDGFEAPRLRALGAALGLEGRVTFHGQVPSAASVFSAFDLFVLSSRTEGTPNVLFEAMAAGVPIVASAVGGVPDVISDAEGGLVAPEDPDALASGIRAVYEDSGRARRRAVAARAKLEAQFAIEPWLDRYEAIYRRVRRAFRESA